MNIRAYNQQDARALEGMFEQQGFQYACPDFGDSGLISKTVLEIGGNVRMAVLARLTAEIYFLIDPSFGTPLQKWEAFKELHEASRLDCYGRGLDDVCCWVPPAIDKSFGRRLLRLGWGRNVWQSYTRSVKEPTADLKENCYGSRPAIAVEQIANR